MRIGGLPEEVYKELEKTTTKIRVRFERRKFGKIVTIVELTGDKRDLADLAKDLKKKLACGGATKDDRIELQGNHKDKIKRVLVDLGYAEDQIEITR